MTTDQSSTPQKHDISGSVYDDGSDSCVVCGEHLEDGDLVYWSTNDDGHMHAECATSYVDDDGKETDVPPKPMKFRVPPSPQTHLETSKVEPRFAVGDMVERVSGGAWMGMDVGDKGVVSAVLPTANNWHDLKIDGFDGVYSDFRFRLAEKPSPQTRAAG